MTIQIRVRIAKSNFAAGLKFCRSHKGDYDPTSKTWLVAADECIMGHLSNLGIELAFAGHTPYGRNMSAMMDAEDSCL